MDDTKWVQDGVEINVVDDKEEEIEYKGVQRKNRQQHYYWI